MTWARVLRECNYEMLINHGRHGSSRKNSGEGRERVGVDRAVPGLSLTLMRHMLHDAEAVLVLNPIIAALLEPFARRVCIVPWGIDPARFPWPADEEDSELQAGENAHSVVGSHVAAMGLKDKEAADVQFPGFAPGLYDLALPGLLKNCRRSLRSPSGVRTPTPADRTASLPSPNRGEMIQPGM